MEFEEQFLPEGMDLYDLVGEMGIDFSYKGDGVVMLWSCIPGPKFLSISFQRQYDTLEEIDKEWEAFDRYIIDKDAEGFMEVMYLL